jgi:hypothetical protein
VKHAIAKRIVIQFHLQVVNAASVQKRDVFQDLINTALVPIAQIQQQIQAGISQAQILIQGIQSQISSVIASVTADLQARAKVVTDQITTIVGEVAKIPTCAIGQTANVTNIVTQAGMALHQLFKLLATFSVKSCEYGNEHTASIRTVKHFAYITTTMLLKQDSVL